HLVQHASQIKLRQSVVSIKSNGALEVLGSLLEIPILVVERSTVEQRVYLLRVDLQSAVIGLDRVVSRACAGLAGQCWGKPVLSAAPACAGRFGNNAHLFVNFASLEVQDELPGDRFETGSMSFDDDVFAVRENTQLGQRRLRFAELLAKGIKRALQPVDGHALFN